MFDFDVLELSILGEREEREAAKRRRLTVNPIRLDIPVSDVPRGPALMLAPETTVGSAIEMMRRRRCGAAIVLRNQRPLGVVTDRDILGQLVGELDDFKAAPVETLMSPCPDPLREHDSVATALRKMCSQRLWYLPLVCDRGLLVGAIDIAEVSLWLRDRLMLLSVEAAVAT